MEPFKEFRAPKTPLWSRLIGDWRAWHNARRARKTKHHIATVSLWGRNRNTGDPVCGYLHLFETGKGKRSYTFERGELSRITDYREWTLYHVTIIPWMHGKFSNETIANWAAKTRQRA